MKVFRFGKYSFKSFDEFKAVQDLAIANGFNTAGDFNKFLDANYSDLKNINQ